MSATSTDVPTSTRLPLAELPATVLPGAVITLALVTDQARRAVERLAPAEVHVVVTARHAAGMLAAGWQEMVKNGSRTDLHAAAAADTRSEFGWRTWDLAGVLERWGDVVPPERLHVLPVPPRTEPPDRHWRNLAGVLGLTGDYPVPEEADGRATLNGWTARVVEGRLEVTGDGEDADWWRVVATACWRHLDTTGGPADVADTVPPGPVRRLGAE